MPPVSSLAVIEFLRKALSRLDAKISQLSNLYRRTESEILANILADLATQEIITLRDRRRREAEVQRMLRILDDAAQVQVPEIMHHAAEVARRAGGISFGEKPAPLSVTNRQAVTMLTENLLEDLGAATRTVGRRVDDIFRKETLHKAQARVLQEVPSAHVSSELQRALNKQGITSFYDKLGRQWTLAHYTEMATKTVALEAVNAVQVQLLSERGVDLVGINVSPKCCEECREFDGGTFSLTGRAPGVPILKRYPPFHGNCHHVVFASPDAFQERAQSGWTPADVLTRTLVGAQ